MKKLLIVLMCLTMLAATASPGLACRRGYGSRTAYAHVYPARRVYYSYGPRRVYYSYRPRYYYAYAPRRTFWQKHRDKLTLALGTAGGAAFGGLIGGRRGAGIGALVGVGSSALYTYGLRKRHHYRRY
jgi:hypothetical protein